MARLEKQITIVIDKLGHEGLETILSVLREKGNWMVEGDNEDGYVQVDIEDHTVDTILNTGFIDLDDKKFIIEENPSTLILIA